MSNELGPASGDAEEGSRSPPDPGSRESRLIALLVTVVFYIMLLASQFAPTAKGFGEPDAAKVDGSASGVGHATGAAGEDPGLSREELDEFIAQTRQEPSAIILRLLMAAQERLGSEGSFVRSQIPVGDEDDALEMLRIAVMHAELGDTERSLRTLDGVRVDALNDDARATREFLRGAYGGGAIDEGEHEAALRTIGWWATLKATAGDPSAPERARALASGHRLLNILIVVLIGAGVVAVASIACMVVMIVRMSGGRLRRRLDAPAPGGSAYLETFAVFLVAFAVVQVVGMLVMSASPGVGAPVSILAQWSLAIVPLWALLRGADMARLRKNLGWHRGEGVLREVGAGIFGYLAGLPVFAGAIVLTQVLVGIVSGVTGERIEPNTAVFDALGGASTWVIVALVSLVVLWAPLVEETVFRGALLRHVRSRVGIAGGALVTGTLFAFLHSYGPLFTLPLITLGVMFALLREWRGSLIAPMTAHFLHNATLITLMLVFLRASA